MLYLLPTPCSVHIWVNNWSSKRSVLMTEWLVISSKVLKQFCALVTLKVFVTHGNPVLLDLSWPQPDRARGSGTMVAAAPHSPLLPRRAGPAAPAHRCSPAGMLKGQPGFWPPAALTSWIWDHYFPLAQVRGCQPACDCIRASLGEVPSLGEITLWCFSCGLGWFTKASDMCSTWLKTRLVLIISNCINSK